MSGINEVGMPKRGARSGVCIEGVKTFMLRGNDNDIVLSRRRPHGYLGNPERLGVDRAVGQAREEFAEGGSIDGRSGKSELVSVRAVTRKIVVVRKYAQEVGDSDNKRSGSGAVADARGRDGVNAGNRRRRVRDWHSRGCLRDRECATGGAGAAGPASGPVNPVRVRGSSGYGQRLADRDCATFGIHGNTNNACRYREAHTVAGPTANRDNNIAGRRPGRYGHGDACTAPGCRRSRTKHQPNNSGGGILTLYLIGTAWLTARRRDGETSRFDCDNPPDDWYSRVDERPRRFAHPGGVQVWGPR